MKESKSGRKIHNESDSIDDLQGKEEEFEIEEDK